MQKKIHERGDKCNVYSVYLQTVGKNTEFLAYPRVWYKPDEMEYYGRKHYNFRNKDHNKINIPHEGDHSCNLIEGITIGHDYTLRSQYYMKGRRYYQTWLENFEKKLDL